MFPLENFITVSWCGGGAVTLWESPPEKLNETYVSAEAEITYCKCFEIKVSASLLFSNLTKHLRPRFSYGGLFLIQFEVVCDYRAEGRVQKMSGKTLTTKNTESHQ